MLVGFAFRALVKCPECQTGLPIQRVVATERCESCAAPVGVGKKLSADVCDEEQFGWVVFGGQVDDEADRVYRARAMPACEACTREIAPAELEAALATGRFACPCGVATRVRAADPILKGVTGLRYIAGELLDHEAPKPSAQPMVMACATCTAPLTLDGSSRTVVCTYCDVSNILPEGIWRQLRPARQRRTIFLVLDLTDAELDRRTYGGAWFDDEVGEQAGADPAAPLEALRGHASYGDEPARRAVAGNPSAPPELLATLAADRALEVRRAVAKNPHASPELLATLAADPELADDLVVIPRLPAAARRTMIVSGAPRIRAWALGLADRAMKVELAAAEGIPADVLDVLATDADLDVLRAVAGNPAIPPPRLVELGHHADRTVVAAARKNPSYKKKWWQF